MLIYIILYDLYNPYVSAHASVYPRAFNCLWVAKPISANCPLPGRVDGMSVEFWEFYYGKPPYFQWEIMGNSSDFIKFLKKKERKNLSLDVFSFKKTFISPKNCKAQSTIQEVMPPALKWAWIIPKVDLWPITITITTITTITTIITIIIIIIDLWCMKFHLLFEWIEAPNF